MATMKAVQVTKARGDFELVERPIPEPERNQVRIKVDACGVCHSDVMVKDGLWPGLAYPRIPGHEIAGRVDRVGADVTIWKTGQRVGVGWHGGHCFACDPCRRGDFILCRFEKITSLSFDGGYAEYIVVPAEAVAAMPDDLPSAEAAPLLCAGLTVYNPLRNSGARAGELVAIQAIGRGADKDAFVRKLGAHEYVDGAVSAPAESLQKLGGARVILATAPDAKAISA